MSLHAPSSEASQDLLLTERARLQSAQKIEAFFTRPDAPEIALPGEMMDMLNTSQHTLYYAMLDTGVIDHRAPRPRTMASATPEAQESLFSSDRSQAEQLNVHPYIRTVSIGELSETLDFSRSQIAEVARDLNVPPIFYSTAIEKPADTLFEWHGYFDLDQVEMLREGLQRYNAPEKFVPDSTFVNGLGVTPAVLQQMKEHLGIGIAEFRNPAAGHMERYTSPQDAGRLVMHLAANGFRRVKE